ncbi:hypothetical protein SDJN03_00864, partial [Cucurbita argyrosperma subsp. sororia]
MSSKGESVGATKSSARGNGIVLYTNYSLGAYILIAYDRALGSLIWTRIPKRIVDMNEWGWAEWVAKCGANMGEAVRVEQYRVCIICINDVGIGKAPKKKQSYEDGLHKSLKDPLTKQIREKSKKVKTICTCSDSDVDVCLSRPRLGFSSEAFGDKRLQNYVGEAKR